MVEGKINLLLIEDDEDDYILAREIIDGMVGINVHLDWVDRFEEAEKMMLSGAYNVCLVDYQLGEGNGIDLLKSAREKGNMVPVIMLTGQGDHDIDMAAMDAGAADYLVKGELDSTMLERSIRYALNMGEKIDELREANEKLRELDRMKSELVVNVSHELRTPLTSIKSFAEILLDEADTLTTEEVRNYLEIINGESDRLARLINDFLDIKKIEEGKTTWHDEVLDMTVLCLNAVEQYSSTAAKKSISISFEDSGDVYLVKVDRDRIIQVLTNIILNAIKFSDKGGKIKVALGKGSKEGVGESVIVSISDNGYGISEKEQVFIFDRFYQANNPGEVKADGTGLGLSICKEIVEHYGGTIWVESGAEAGTVFFFTLPEA